MFTFYVTSKIHLTSLIERDPKRAAIIILFIFIFDYNLLIIKIHFNGVLGFWGFVEMKNVDI